MPITKSDPLMEDFRNYLAALWKFLGLPQPTKIQYEIAEYLQYGPKRQEIEAFRGVGKSWITSGYTTWQLKKDRDFKFLIVSASKVRSDDFSTFTQRVIMDWDYLKELRPKKKGEMHKPRWSKIAFDVEGCKPAHAPSVKSVGIFGQLTGSRATHIIADDTEVAQNALTQDAREKLIGACMEFEAIIVPDIGRITYLGTCQTEESIYNKLRERGYEARIWPARVPDAQTKEGYRGALAPSLEDRTDVGAPTDPKRFDDTDLIEREAAYGRSGFALQFMLDTRLSDALKYPLKLSDLIVTDVGPDKAPASIQYGSGKDQQLTDISNPGFTGDRWYGPMFYDKERWSNYEGRAMFIDPSGRGADETTFCILNQLFGNLWLPELDGTKSIESLKGIQSGYDPEVLRYLAKKAKQYKVNYILVEDNFGDGMFVQVLKPMVWKYHQCTIEGITHTKQKERRIIDTLEPVMNQHRLIVGRDVVNADLTLLQQQNCQQYSLFYQMTRLTKERGALKHDDRLDCLAMGVNYWLDSMGRDDSNAEEDFRKRELEKELEDHIRACKGLPKHSPTGGAKWVNIKR